MANPDGTAIAAAVASPPSPLYGRSLDTSAESAAPVPAIVVIMPVLAVTFRMR